MKAITRVATAIVITVVGIGFIGALAACDNPVEDHDHDHAEAAGLILEINGQEAVRVADAQVTGTIAVPLGDHVDVEVEFIDEDGEHLHAEDLDDEFSLQVEIEEGSDVVTVDSVRRWSFHLEGDNAGDAKIKVQLIHDGHADFTTPDISVRVS